MKTLYYIGIFITLFTLSCENESYNEKKSVAVIVDITESISEESLNSEVVVGDIMDALEINENYAGSVQLTIHTLDDVSGSKAQTIKLGKDEKGNSIVRKNKIEEFKADIKSAIIKILQSPGEKQSSKIYSKLCRIIRKYEGKKVSYIMYSDLLENSQLATFYDNSTLADASEDPVKFTDNYLSQDCEITNMSNQEVFIYPLRTPKTDNMVSEAEKYWRELLTDKGADVSINAL